jgi:acetyl esterase/lipase
MHRSTPIRSVCAAALMLLAAGAHAQDTPRKPGLDDFVRMAQANPPRPAPAPSIQPIPLSAAGSRATDMWETMFGQTTLRNVTQPALYPVLPPPGQANGTALVIAPGGAFLSLSFDNEGLLVARRLAERGVTCFVLAYRLDPTPQDPAAFMQAVAKRFGGIAQHGKDSAIDTPAVAQAQDDGLAALRWVRAHAADYGIDTKRIGMRRMGTTSDHWIEHFVQWMQVSKLVPQ